MPRAVVVEGLSKAYRIGARRGRSDTLAKSILDLARRPLVNYRHLRRLTRDLDGPGASDVVWALKDVNFEVEHGEVLGVIGPNGAGKSTLLKILARISAPTAGSARIRGRVSSLLEVGTGFHPELTGRENVYLNGTILGLKRSEVGAKLDEIVAFSGVERFLDTPLKRYSSGMGVRLAFAVAAHLECEVLLVDEVLAVGDAAFRRKCIGKMKQVATQGRTVLFVSHNMSALLELCTQAILVKGGELVGSGSPEKVVEEYLHHASAAQPLIDLTTADRRPGRISGARMLSARLLTSEGKETLSFKSGRDLTFEVTFQTSGLRAASLGFAIQDYLGRRVYATNMSHSGDTLEIDSDGSHSITAQLPVLPLSPGTYSITLNLGDGRADADIIEDAVYFDVVWRLYLGPKAASGGVGALGLAGEMGIGRHRV